MLSTAAVLAPAATRLKGKRSMIWYYSAYNHTKHVRRHFYNEHAPPITLTA